MRKIIRLSEPELKRVVFESVRRIMNEDVENDEYDEDDDDDFETTHEYVDVNNFVYKGKRLTYVGEGDSFCYCPCDIHGTPKMYYANSHRECADIATEEILHSFGANERELSDDEWENIVEDIWLDSCGRGRVFFNRYIVVEEDGHIPNKEYIDGIISYLGGTYDDYVVAFCNPFGGVMEISCKDAFKYGENDKPDQIEVPYELIELYNKKNSVRNAVNKKFPTNMTRAQYYSLTRQESKISKKPII